MLPDLERLISLQQLDSDTDQRKKWVSELPGRLAAFETRLAERRAAGEAARQALADDQHSRRVLEKDLSVVQGRLTKYKDQLMEVKTNKEYLAMQHEIASAQEGVGGFEDQILALLVLADEQTAAVKAAEQALADEERSIASERAALEARRAKVDTELAELTASRSALVGQISRELVALYDSVASTRHGTAVVEVRDGHCTACHVRLRSQFFIELRRSERVFQCESCSRILFVLPPPAPEAPALKA